MNKKTQRSFSAPMGMLTAFLLWTAAVRSIDLQPIGPEGSTVGFAAINQFVHNLTGVHMLLYTITDLLGLVPLLFVAGFGMLGLFQWIQRKHLSKVDYSILVLGGYYIIVMAIYLFFEVFIINYRPILINGCLEASYPSSTTMLVMCVMPTAEMQLNSRLKSQRLKRCAASAITVFTVFMVIGRLISGVHWFTDSVGGILLSTGLVLMVGAVLRLKTSELQPNVEVNRSI